MLFACYLLAPVAAVIGGVGVLLNFYFIPALAVCAAYCALLLDTLFKCSKVGGWAGRQLVIRLTRHVQYRGRAYDDDNTARALKPYRDGVADALRVDDGSERLTWVVDQVRDGQRGVTVELWVRP